MLELHPEGIQLIQFLPKAIEYGLYLYLLCKVFDFATGILKTWKFQSYKSARMREGLIRWASELLALFFVAAFDFVLGLNFYVLGLTLALFIYKEGGSVMENLHELEVELPGAFAKSLETFNKNNKDGEGE